MRHFIDVPESLYVETLLPRWHGMILAIVCLFQFGVSILIDRRYEAKIGRTYYWMVWYPMAYWVLSMFTTVVAVPKVLFGGRKRAIWTSPDRGFR